MCLLIIIVGVCVLPEGSSHSAASFYLLGFDNKILFFKKGSAKQNKANMKPWVLFLAHLSLHSVTLGK